MSIIRSLAGIFPAIIFYSLIFCGCSKSSSSDSSCADTAPPEITAETSITAGTDLQLNVSPVPNAQYYLWSGPNNFRSEEQNPLITNVQSAGSGVYTVEVGVSGGCVLTSNSDSISVALPAASCNPADNTAHIDGVGSIEFYSASGAPSGQTYMITANGIGGDVELQFPGSDKPGAGIYSIRALNGQWIAGDVRLRLVSQNSNWDSYDGKVRLEYNSQQKFVITFCSIPVSGQTVTFNTTASGKFIEH